MSLMPPYRIQTLCAAAGSRFPIHVVLHFDIVLANRDLEPGLARREPIAQSRQYNSNQNRPGPIHRVGSYWIHRRECEPERTVHGEAKTEQIDRQTIGPEFERTVPRVLALQLPDHNKEDRLGI